MANQGTPHQRAALRRTAPEELGSQRIRRLSGPARDRHGRGMRAPLLPADVPGFRTRAELFDQAVLDAVADLEDRWPGQLQAIEFAVDEVPALSHGPVLPSSDVVVDEGVPLSRFLPPGVDGRGRATKARVVVYRRPVELRAVNAADLADLVMELLAEQLHAILGDGTD